MPSIQDSINWINNSIGKRYDTDGYYGAQCKDLANAYAAWHGHPLVASNAGPTWSLKQDPYWQKLPNTPTFIPQAGDIAIWGANPGHIALVLDANINTFRSVDQNWFNANSTVGSPAALVNHNYNGVTGFLRPTYATQSGDNVIKDGDAVQLRIVSSEVKGWDRNEVHSGRLDSRELNAWKGTPWPVFLQKAWDESEGYRATKDRWKAFYDKYSALIADLEARPTKAAYDELLTALQKEADKVKKAEDAEKVAVEKANSAAILAAKEKADRELLEKQASEDTKNLNAVSGALKSIVEFVKGLLTRKSK